MRAINIEYKRHLIHRNEFDSHINVTTPKGYDFGVKFFDIEEAKELIDMNIEYDHLDWKISYYDENGKFISKLKKDNCSQITAERFAIENKPENAATWTIHQLGLYVWQRFWKYEWEWPEIQNNPTKWEVDENI